jgi:hypothetical protein
MLIRMGSYGDPAAAPHVVWTTLISRGDRSRP